MVPVVTVTGISASWLMRIHGTFVGPEPEHHTAIIRPWSGPPRLCENFGKNLHTVHVCLRSDLGQDLDAFRRDQQRVLKLRCKAPVLGHHCPLVVPGVALGVPLATCNRRAN